MHRPASLRRLIAVAVLTVCLTPATWAWAGPPAGDDASPSPESQARTEVSTASAAFAAGDYATALVHYQAALALLPAAKLHYNIAVCHQRLALAAETSAERTRQRDLAIDSYNRYLAANPRATDRLEVAATIRKLGGRPVTQPALLDPVFDTPPSAVTEADEEDDDDELDDDDDELDDEDDDELDEEGDDELDDDDDELDEEGDDDGKPYLPHHGRFGVSLTFGLSSDLIDATAVDGRLLVGIDLHGGGFVGRKRRFLIAAHTALYSGAFDSNEDFTLGGYSVGLMFLQTWTLGLNKRGMVGFGGLAALTGQSIRPSDDAVPPLCSDNSGTALANRTGGLFSPRLEVSVLAGARRRSLFTLLVQPGFTVYGPGPSSELCPPGQTPLTIVGVERRWEFLFFAGIGYAFRF